MISTQHGRRVQIPHILSGNEIGNPENPYATELRLIRE